MHGREIEPSGFSCRAGNPGLASVPALGWDPLHSLPVFVLTMYLHFYIRKVLTATLRPPAVSKG